MAVDAELAAAQALACKLDLDVKLLVRTLTLTESLVRYESLVT